MIAEFSSLQLLNGFFFVAHTDRFPGTSSQWFKSRRVDRGWKYQLGRVKFWEPERLRRCRKRKEERRGHGTEPPTGGPLRSSIKSGFHPAAHCSTAGCSHAGQLWGCFSFEEQIFCLSFELSLLFGIVLVISHLIWFDWWSWNKSSEVLLDLAT